MEFLKSAFNYFAEPQKFKDLSLPRKFAVGICSGLFFVSVVGAVFSPFVWKGTTNLLAKKVKPTKAPKVAQVSTNVLNPKNKTSDSTSKVKTDSATSTSSTQSSDTHSSDSDSDDFDSSDPSTQNLLFQKKADSATSTSSRHSLDSDTSDPATQDLLLQKKIEEFKLASTINEQIEILEKDGVIILEEDDEYNFENLGIGDFVLKKSDLGVDLYWRKDDKSQSLGNVFFSYNEKTNLYKTITEHFKLWPFPSGKTPYEKNQDDEVSAEPKNAKKKPENKGKNGQDELFDNQKKNQDDLSSAEPKDAKKKLENQERDNPIAVFENRNMVYPKGTKLRETLGNGKSALIRTKNPNEFIVVFKSSKGDYYKTKMMASVDLERNVSRFIAQCVKDGGGQSPVKEHSKLQKENEPAPSAEDKSIEPFDEPKSVLELKPVVNDQIAQYAKIHSIYPLGSDLKEILENEKSAYILTEQEDKIILAYKSPKGNYYTKEEALNKGTYQAFLRFRRECREKEGPLPPVPTSGGKYFILDRLGGTTLSKDLGLKLGEAVLLRTERKDVVELAYCSTDGTIHRNKKFQVSENTDHEIDENIALIESKIKKSEEADQTVDFSLSTTPGNKYPILPIGAGVSLNPGEAKLIRTENPVMLDLAYRTKEGKVVGVRFSQTPKIEDEVGAYIRSVEESEQFRSSSETDRNKQDTSANEQKEEVPQDIDKELSAKDSIEENEKEIANPEEVELNKAIDLAKQFEKKAKDETKKSETNTYLILLPNGINLEKGEYKTFPGSELGKVKLLYKSRNGIFVTPREELLESNLQDEFEKFQKFIDKPAIHLKLKFEQANYSRMMKKLTES